MIKIVSGLSIPVGSTVALVNLCNQFNDRGYDCIFYGPDNWHLDKCRAGNIADFHPEDGDIIIVHHIRLFSVDELYKLQDKIAQPQKTGLSSLMETIQRTISRTRKHAGIKVILSCQENELFPLRQVNHALFDKIHYIHGEQVRYHRITHSHFICPNFCNDLLTSERKPRKVAGVIGSIRKENQIDRSIVKAIEDGMDTVIVYGYLLDPVYYYRKIVPLTKTYVGRIKFAGFIDNKQKVYDSLSDVYCAVRKRGSLVEKECHITNTRFHGADSSPGSIHEEESMTNDRIFQVWKQELGL
ncbi:MAG: hypothetical protein V1764_00130 [Nitrospirota bacterium]